jgi:hypothetical protein
VERLSPAREIGPRGAEQAKWEHWQQLQCLKGQQHINALGRGFEWARAEYEDGMHDSDEVSSQMNVVLVFCKLLLMHTADAAAAAGAAWCRFRSLGAWI